MVEFNRNEKSDIKTNINFHLIILYILILLLILITILLIIKIYDSYKKINDSKIEYYELGIIEGKKRCIICPKCEIITCPVCESPNQTIMNIAKEQTDTGNIILYNGSHIVTLNINQLCENL